MSLMNYLRGMKVKHKKSNEEDSFLIGQLLGYTLSDPVKYKLLDEKAKAAGTTIKDMITKKLKRLELEPSWRKGEGILTGKSMTWPKFKDDMEVSPPLGGNIRKIDT